MPRLLTRSNNNNNNNNMVQCKKHPKHKQSPGVCSLCLGEKLSRVSPTTTSSSRDRLASRALEYYCSSSSLSSSEDESSYASSCASPMHEEGHHQHHRRVISDVNLDTFKYSNKNKSMPFDEVEENDNKKKVVKGFWSKFLRPRRNTNNRVIINDGKNKVYMSQPLGVASSSRIVV